MLIIWLLILVALLLINTIYCVYISFNDKKINNVLRVIRNHGEVCSTAKDNKHLRRGVDGEDSKEQNYNYADDVLPGYGLLGFNFRMTELADSLIYSQWKRNRNYRIKWYKNNAHEIDIQWWQNDH